MKFDIHSPAFNLAGITLKPAYYDAETWESKCGVNPLDYPQFFTTNKFGKIYAKELFHKCWKARSNAIHSNWSALGIAS